jgi:hypothetical protein
MKEKKLYFSYIGLGILYLAVKVIFVSVGYLHLGAIAHGSIPAILTVLAGFLAKKEESKKLIWHWLVVILPLLGLIVTPIFMYFKMGEEWLANGRLPVLVIYETIATMQSVLGLVLIRSKRSNS